MTKNRRILSAAKMLLCVVVTAFFLLNAKYFCEIRAKIEVVERAGVSVGSYGYVPISVSIEGKTVNRELISIISSLSSIRSIVCRECNVTPDGFAEMAGMRDLSELKLECSAFELSGIQELAKCTKLERITVSRSNDSAALKQLLPYVSFSVDEHECGSRQGLH